MERDREADLDRLVVVERLCRLPLMDDSSVSVDRVFATDLGRREGEDVVRLCLDEESKESADLLLDADLDRWWELPCLDEESNDSRLLDADLDR